VPEQTSLLQYPPSSALSSNTSDIFSTLSDPSSAFDQTVLPPTGADFMGLGAFYSDIYTGPTPYNSSLDFNSEFLPYDGSYGPVGYTSARALTADLQPQPPGLQGLDLDLSSHFLSNYPEVGLDSTSTYDWSKGGYDYGDSPMIADPLLDRETSSIWTNENTSQDFRLWSQYGSPLSVGSPCSSQV
jgi:hypothetical protein